MSDLLEKQLKEKQSKISELEIKQKEGFASLGAHLLTKKESAFAQSPLGVTYHEAGHTREYLEKLQSEWNNLQFLAQNLEKKNKELQNFRDEENRIVKTQAPSFSRLGEAAWSYYRTNHQSFENHGYLFADLETLNRSYSELSSQQEEIRSQSKGFWSKMIGQTKGFLLRTKHWRLDKKLEKAFYELGKSMMKTDLLENLDPQVLQDVGDEILKNQAHIKSTFLKIQTLEQDIAEIEGKLEECLFGEGLSKRISALSRELQSQQEKYDESLQKLGEGYFFLEEPLLPNSKTLTALIKPLMEFEKNILEFRQEAEDLTKGLELDELKKVNLSFEQEQKSLLIKKKEIELRLEKIDRGIQENKKKIKTLESDLKKNSTIKLEEKQDIEWNS